jgi:hypothetical protein
MFRCIVDSAARSIRETVWLHCTSARPLATYRVAGAGTWQGRVVRQVASPPCDAARWSPQELGVALLRHTADHDLAGTEDSPFGKRYLVEGIMNTPIGRSPMPRSVWFIETRTDAPRSITGYPLRRDDDESAR